MIKISERLQVAASMICEGNRLADVGTDHGYVPIYLLQQKRIPSAIAMDINLGPLERAKEHIRLYQLEEYIQTRLSDGVEALLPGEADSILIAGMGGGLIIHILEDGEAICQEASELILQPQSELCRVRKFLDEHGYVVDAEEMVLEEGKYYPMMRVHYDANACGQLTEKKQVAYQYGEKLLAMRHPVLQQYLHWEKEIQEQILHKLKGQSQTEQIAERVHEVEETLRINEEALTYYR